MHEGLSLFSKCFSWSKAKHGLSPQVCGCFQKEHADTSSVRSYWKRPGSMLPCNNGQERNQMHVSVKKAKQEGQCWGTQQQAWNV